MAREVPDRDATVVARLRAAGALIFGKTNLPEFAYGPVDSYHYGPTRNPWDLDAVRGRFEHGFGRCGRGRGGSRAHWAPTRRVRSETPRRGAASSDSSRPTASCRCAVSSLGTSLDHVGPIARSAADCARILEVIAGVDPNDPTSEPFPPAPYVDGLDRTITGVRVGVVRSLWDGLSDVVAAPLCRATRALRHLGVELVDVEIGWWDEVVEAGELLVECEAAAEYGAILEVSATELLPEVSHRLRSGAATTAPDYVRARRIATRVPASIPPRSSRRAPAGTARPSPNRAAHRRTRPQARPKHLVAIHRAAECHWRPGIDDARRVHREPADLDTTGRTARQRIPAVGRRTCVSTGYELAQPNTQPEKTVRSDHE